MLESRKCCADAIEEALNGAYSQFQLSELVDRTQVIQTALRLLALIYSHSAKQLSAEVAKILIKLPGGEDWINRQK